ncbi:MAG TPA: lysylphosphatidylglycerol synthase domain-containing protein [Stellaceae bacterium]|jgi:putative membrane protein|nr:lysylphosphatidylglycerol synthase domain-containing protein [Stellaceae bacterium]
MARWLFFLVMALSITGFVALLVLNGLAEIGRGLQAVGWLLVAIVGIRLVALSCAGIGWRIAFGRTLRILLHGGRTESCPERLEPRAGQTWRYVGLRCIREGINSLLPAAQVGGDLVGGRLLARLGVPLGLSMASILVDLLLQAATQGVFALSGLLALYWLVGNNHLVRELGGGLLLAIPALGGFFIAQRFGLFVVVERGIRMVKRLMPGLGLNLPDQPLDLQIWLKKLYADRWAISWACFVHMLGWSTGVAEVWIVLHCLGLNGHNPHGEWVRPLILESLGQAVRSAAFAVPGALGIQEGGFILLGAVFNIPASQAIILSLVKRLPDLAIGIPGLIAWQAMEARFLRQRRMTPVVPEQPAAGE